jgi:hypothetical protein
LVLVAFPLALAACSSNPSPGPGSGSPAQGSAGTKLQHADATLLDHLTAYAAKVTSCKSASNPVVCLEGADRTLGGQVHTYANLLAVGKGLTAPQGDVLAARNQAQSLANSLEILGDAQPTQSNYDQVLNNFNLQGAIGQLRHAVQKLNAAVGG